jgi:hypothetical protein
MSYGTDYEAEMFDSTIRHLESMLASEFPPIVRCALDQMSDNFNVLRVNPLAPRPHDRRGRPLTFQDPAGFV